MSDGFAGRFAEAKKLRGVSNYALSKQTGIRDNLLGKYDAGTIPGLDRASKIAEALDVSLDWLAMGKGNISRIDEQNQSQSSSNESDRSSLRAITGLPIDEKFMARVAVAVADAYREAGQPVSDAATGMEIHRMLTAILQEARHPEEYEDQLAIEKKHLRRRLAEARAHPGLGKASA